VDGFFFCLSRTWLRGYNEFMYFETKVFGPLSFRQFTILGGAAIIIYFIYGNLNSSISIPISILIGLFALYYAFSKKGAEFNEENLKKYKTEVSEEKFQRFTKKMVAELYSTMRMREEKGFKEDPKLQEALDLIDKISKSE
jgi:hypothetical protein